MNRSLVLLVLAILSTASLVTAQQTSKADYQFRLLLHKQVSVGPSGFGAAVWWVLPDITADGDGWRSLLVAGPSYRSEDRWIELMGGVMVHQSRDDEVLVNLRVSERSLPGVNLLADLEFFPGADRFYAWVGGDHRLFGIGNTVVRGGIESENILFGNGRRDVYGIGPRVSLVPWRSVALTAAYQVRNDQDFIRIYVLFAP